MMSFVKSSIEDADVVLYVTDVFDEFEDLEFLTNWKDFTEPIVGTLIPIFFITYFGQHHRTKKGWY
jgi:hypothetical protein